MDSKPKPKMTKKKKIWTIVGVSLAVLFVAGALINNESNPSDSSSQVTETKVKVLKTESSFAGKQYTEVVTELQGWGFTNIENIPVYDIVWGITQPGTTKTVTIDGSSDYKRNDEFEPNVPVVVRYSMPVGDDPANKKYTITWKNYDGTTLKTEELKAGVMPSFGTNVPTKPALNEIKYVFNGWIPEVEAVKENATYTATYLEAANLFKITFNLNGGNWSLNNVQEVLYNGVITTTIPTRNGYEFSGWVIKGTFSDTPFNPATQIKQDYTLTATWTEIKHTVTFDLDGGTWSRSNEQQVSDNGLITTTKPTKAGYDFDGWLLGDSLFDITTPVTEDLNLKAKWNAINFEEILVGRWDGSLGLNQGHLRFIEFSGVYYDSNGERKSTLIDDDYDTVEFTLIGNKIGINYSDVGMIYYTITYTSTSLTLSAPGYYNYRLSKTDSESNSASYKWGRLYNFAKQQSSLKSDELGYYYEIVMNSSIRSISPNNKLIESNQQIIKVYTNKVLGIDLYYVGVDDPSISMKVTFALIYDNIANSIITNPFIVIESEGYGMQSVKGTIEIEFDRELDKFFFTAKSMQLQTNNFPNLNPLLDLKYFSVLALYEASYYLLTEHGIYLFSV